MGTGHGNNSDMPSWLSLVSCLVGVGMLIIQFMVLFAVLVGVKDSQGIIYALTLPFFMYCIGVPVGFLTAMGGLMQRNRDRSYGRLGLALTIAGPLVYALFLMVQVRWHWW